jgi:hypothetical protein
MPDEHQHGFPQQHGLPCCTRPRTLSWTPAFRRPTGDIRILLAGVGEAVEHLSAALHDRQLVARTIRLDLQLADRSIRRQRAFVDPWTAEESVLFRTARRLLARAVEPAIGVARVEVRFDTVRVEATTAPLFRRQDNDVSRSSEAGPSREQRVRMMRFRDQFGQSASSLMTIRR